MRVPGRQVPFDELPGFRSAGHSAGLPLIWGDAAAPSVLEPAHVEHARLLVIATPDPLQERRILELAPTGEHHHSKRWRGRTGKVSCPISSIRA